MTTIPILMTVLFFSFDILARLLIGAAAVSANASRHC